MFEPNWFLRILQKKIFVVRAAISAVFADLFEGRFGKTGCFVMAICW